MYVDSVYQQLVNFSRAQSYAIDDFLSYNLSKFCFVVNSHLSNIFQKPGMLGQ